MAKETRMDWSRLLSTERQSKMDPLLVRNEDPFWQDYISIISSESFRRLQDKTQVFALDKSDYVRTRLTHSLEVSTIARKLADSIFHSSQGDDNNMAKMREELGKKLQYQDKELEKLCKTTTAYDADKYVNDNTDLYEHHVEQISTIVSCAGLLHDIGNPPFGHFGEDLIRNWFDERFSDERFTYVTEKGETKKIGEVLTDKQKADFVNFEGNAQALRILFKNHAKDNSHDMNLTVAVINNIVKYPNASDWKYEKQDVKLHKNGYYHSEERAIKYIAAFTGIGSSSRDGFIPSKNMNDTVAFTRHPLVYIMEAADDIAYATADIADSVRKGIFTVDEFCDHFKNMLDAMMEGKIKNLKVRGSFNHGYTNSYDALKLYVDDVQKAYDNSIDSKEKYVDKILSNYKQMLKEAEKKCTEKSKSDLGREGSEDFTFSVLDWSEPYTNLLNLKVRIKGVSKNDVFAVFENWLDYMRQYFIENASIMFINQYEKIMQGNYEGDLFFYSGDEEAERKHQVEKITDKPSLAFSATWAGETLKIFKKMMINHVYNSNHILVNELYAKNIIYTLLDELSQAMLYYGENDEQNPARRMSDISKRLVKIIPQNYISDYDSVRDNYKEEEDERLYRRLLCVTDFVSGMTDSYAERLFKLITGADNAFF